MNEQAVPDRCEGYHVRISFQALTSHFFQSLAPSDLDPESLQAKERTGYS